MVAPASISARRSLPAWVFSTSQSLTTWGGLFPSPASIRALITMCDALAGRG
jgi:hypothetical protein